MRRWSGMATAAAERAMTDSKEPKKASAKRTTAKAAAKSAAARAPKAVAKPKAAKKPAAAAKTDKAIKPSTKAASKAAKPAKTTKTPKTPKTPKAADAAPPAAEDDADLRASGQLLRQMREQAPDGKGGHGITHAALAKRIGMTAARLKTLEEGGGRDGVSFVILQRAARACDVALTISVGTVGDQTSIEPPAADAAPVTT